MGRTEPSDLCRLAAAAGLQRHWRDVEGCEREVSDDSLASILEALGYCTASRAGISEGVKRIAEAGRGLPAMIVTESGQPTPLPTRAARADLTNESGATVSLPIEAGALPPLMEPGYYWLALSEGTCQLAVAPRRCPLPRPSGTRLWGTALQIPALRGPVEHAFGGLGELDGAVRLLGARGCQAVAINPVHALLPGVGEDFSPYSPSSRTFLNAALADPALLGLAPLPESLAEPLIDWPTALPQRLQALRDSFATLSREQRNMIAVASAREGPDIRRHALHDALFCHFRKSGARDWREWSPAFRDPESTQVQQFARENEEEIAFHLTLQWFAREGLAKVQDTARKAGMAVGLIADLAVGVRPGGSDCWAMPDAMLRSLTIGAPPDPLGPLGQNWSITGLSPQGLRDCGYAPWIAMLRAGLRSAGGLRIDHAFGLSRLWVIPEGGDSAQGAYLSYPFADLVRLTALEAHRASALIVAEDLGTAPPGIGHAFAERDMLGMRVLWFERAADHGFIGAQDYPAHCIALTGTHDTPTVAGWWHGRDLDWAERLGRLPADIDRPKAEEIRDWDRGLLWSTIGKGQRPAPEEPDAVIEATLSHVARSPALLAMAPIEDLLGEVEQQNLPGTTSEHPNWRRRLTDPLDALLDDPVVMRRVAALSQHQP